MTFASCQRPGIFDARQNCVKDDVKCAQTPSSVKDNSATLLLLWGESKMVRTKFSRINGHTQKSALIDQLMGSLG